MLNNAPFPTALQSRLDAKHCCSPPAEPDPQRRSLLKAKLEWGRRIRRVGSLYHLTCGEVGFFD